MGVITNLSVSAVINFGRGADFKPESLQIKEITKIKEYKNINEMLRDVWGSLLTGGYK